ncbi:SDR family NAD(P)-dependent oxidoreductase [Nonomuraea sp. NN258]|uniref:SDR family NAD(P)-dependent oxidoreductase n=1 Tax=Nonomuraea antri TaxID=2730852 RepID=UPI001568C461|nr:SDR family NAD(P)-dependent oxidoreductase [Nonomuraea antri]NRQ38713.1 SDR family NAD(P)-dependent oxidoreductase [Nonomuraea antri]
MGHVLITGATGGIGRALVDALLAAGHQVTAIGRDLDRLHLLDREPDPLRSPDRDPDPLRSPGRLRSPGGGLRAVEADLAEPGSLAAALGDPGEVHALIHCAGISPIATVAEATPETWRRTMAVNVVAAAELIRLTLPALRRARGHVVLVNAAPGTTGRPGWAGFAGSKAALRELADSLRDEEAAHGLRVTTLFPCPTDTDLLREVRAGFGRPHDPARCIRPESLAAMVVWLLAAPPDAYAAELSVIPTPG